MSWTPYFWIDEKYYKELKNKLKYYDAWKFTIAGTKGIILSAGSYSSSHYELHDIIQQIPHYILNGEIAICDRCIDWGEQLTEYKPDEDWD